jgi:hypothetical protein
MQIAALLYRRAGRVVHCAKLHHYNEAPCIFDCAFGDLVARELGARKGTAKKVAANV